MKRFWTLISVILVTVAVGCAGKKTTETDAKAKVEETKKEATQEVKKSTKKKTVVAEPKETADADTTPAATGGEGKVTCKSAGDERTIEVAATQSGGCEVRYTKHGETSTPATAVNGTEYCNGVKAKIQANLAAAGYTCE